MGAAHLIQHDASSEVQIEAHPIAAHLQQHQEPRNAQVSLSQTESLSALRSAREHKGKPTPGMPLLSYAIGLQLTP